MSFIINTTISALLLSYLNHSLSLHKIEYMVELEDTEKGMRLGKYELGRTLGEGNFGKVKFARHSDSGLHFAVKIIEKDKIIDLNITDQVRFHLFPLID